MLQFMEVMKRDGIESANKLTEKMSSEGFMAELAASCRAKEK